MTPKTEESCQYLHFAKSEDIWLKSASKRKTVSLLIEEAHIFQTSASGTNLPLSRDLVNHTFQEVVIQMLNDVCEVQILKDRRPGREPKRNSRMNRERNGVVKYVYGYKLLVLLEAKHKIVVAETL